MALIINAHLTYSHVYVHKFTGTEWKITIIILFSIMESMSYSFPSEACSLPLFPTIFQLIAASSFSLKNTELSYCHISISFHLYPTSFFEPFMVFFVCAHFFCTVPRDIFPHNFTQQPFLLLLHFVDIYVTLNTFNIFCLVNVTYYVCLISPIV